MSRKKTAVTALLIEIDGTEHRLTPDAAKALHAALDELVGPNERVEHHHHSTPIWPNRWAINTPHQVFSQNGGMNGGQSISLSAETSETA